MPQDELRAEQARLDAAEAALDDGVEPDDPSRRRAVPYGFSPARMRCMELEAQLLAEARAADS